MSIVIKVLNKEDGFYSVRIKPEIGHAYVREFSKAALDEYVDGARNYCNWKGYDFIYEDGEKESDKLFNRDSDGDETEYYIEVGCNYVDTKDASNMPDAVSFIMGQYNNGSHELDSLINVSVEDARLFAQAILNLCDRIEGPDYEQ
jgi:hypothetical protein